jgi:hypothetical protein
MGKRRIAVWECICERCGYSWLSRVNIPVRCASERCKSPYWDRPRTPTWAAKAEAEAAKAAKKKKPRKAAA